MPTEESILKKAIEGDINAFQELFSEFQDALKSYLFRLMANRNDAEDITHDAFIKAYDKLSTFRCDSSLKTWVFQIATNLAINALHKRKRWMPDVAAQAKELVMKTSVLSRQILQAKESPSGTYDIKEHIDTCFSCIGKNLPVDQQVAIILKDIYQFSVKEIMTILGQTEGQVKYLLQSSRKTMINIFEKRCALVSKAGVCHQCSELNGWLNPKQQQQEALMKIHMVKAAEKSDQEQLFRMRTELVRYIDPLKSSGHALQEILMDCNRMAMGEMEIPA